MDKDLVRKLTEHAQKNDNRNPFYIFDEKSFQQRLQETQQRLGDAKLVYAIKANPLLIGAADGICNYFEVCSSGELEICQRSGVAMEKVVFTGLLKTVEDVNFALDSKVGIISAQSPFQLKLIEEYAQSHQGCVIDIMLRLSSDNMFGMDEQTLECIIARYDELQKKGVNLVALHFFNGTQKKMVHTLEEVRNFVAFAEHLQEKYDFRAEFLEFGAGLRVPYFVNDEFSTPFTELEELAACLKETGWPFRIELGRYVSANCGYYVAQALDVKHNHGHAYAILNGGVGHFKYYGANNGMRVPVITQLRSGKEVLTSEDNPQAQEWTLCGPICSEGDIVVRKKKMADLQTGDILVFHNVGAYSVTESMFLFLSRPLPEICFYENSKLKVVRKSIKASVINSVESQ